MAYMHTHTHPQTRTQRRAPVHAVEVAEDLAVLLDRLELQRANIGREAARTRTREPPQPWYSRGTHGVLTGYSRAYRPKSVTE
jgi:hypothetical protein